MSKIVGYARVSSREQHLDRQIIALKEYVSEDMIVTDKASGKDLNRPGYSSLKYGIGKLVEGDVLIIKSLDRLSRNKKDIKKELQYYGSIGVRVKILDIPTTMMDYVEGQEWICDMVNSILIEVISSIAENERVAIKQRQLEGIEAMKVDENGKRISSRTGNPIGRPTIQYPENWDDVILKWEKNEITAQKAMSMLCLKRTTFYKLLKNKQKEN